MRLNPTRSLLLGSCLLAGSVNALYAASEEEPQVPASAPSSGALVTVNGRTITQMLYSAYHRAKQQGQPTAAENPQQQLAILNELVNFVLLEQDAVAKKLDQNPGVAAQLELGRSRLLASVAIGEYLRTQNISESELQQTYDREYKENPLMEYRLKHILLDTQQEAESVIDALNQGEDFSLLAQSRSSDSSSKTDGDLGWLSSGQMDPSVKQAVEQMDEGSYTKTPVQSDFGWHVLLLEKRRQIPQPSFAEMRAGLLQKKQQALLAGYIQELRSKAELVVDAQQAPKEGEKDAKTGTPTAKE